MLAYFMRTIWNILRPFGISQIWYSLGSFGTFSFFLVFWTKKHLATLSPWSAHLERLPAAPTRDQLIRKTETFREISRWGKSN
jgi:hypothetical protein